MPRGFEDRVALVTGASQGIGRTVALAFAAEGARVALAARSAEKLEAVAAEIAAHGGEAVPVAVDVGDEASVEALRRRVAGSLGDIDVLVNCAGIAGPTALLWEQDPADWQQVFRINVTGTFLCARAFMPSLIATRGSAVVIGSRTGKSPLFGRTPYAGSKTALIGIVRTLAAEAGPLGVRVNLISPGAVDGERLQGQIEAQARIRGVGRDAVLEEFVAASPLRRLVTPEDIAETTLFLCSGRARSITGEDVSVAAGLNSYL